MEDVISLLARCGEARFWWRGSDFYWLNGQMHHASTDHGWVFQGQNLEDLFLPQALLQFYIVRQVHTYDSLM